MTNSPEIRNYRGTPAVSILIATYNSELYIKRTLDSILAQTFVDFQCIISDDCSTDRTLELCDHYSRSDSRFSILRNSENLGWVGNVNRLLDQVDSEFFMIMPHDDALAPHYLANLIEALRANPEAIVSYSDMECIYPDGKRETLSFFVDAEKDSAEKRATTILWGGCIWAVIYRGLVRTKLTNNEVRLRRHMAGEVMADKAWALDLARISHRIKLRMAAVWV